MDNQQCGSEKLLANCAGLQILSQEEREQVAGAGLLSSPMGVTGTVGFVGWPLFPFSGAELHAGVRNATVATKLMDGAASPG